MDRQGYNASCINLDPGVTHLPYSPDIDIREWFVLSEIMEEYGLGPNGAQIVAADLTALRAQEIKAQTDELTSDYFLIDTPGQMELFTFRECSSIIIKALNKEGSAIVFLYDPMLSTTPSSFVSQIMLGATTQFRFYIPTINILSKADMLSEEQLQTILEWSRNTDMLFDAIIGEAPSMEGQLNIELFQALENLGTYKELIPVSAEDLGGIEDLYAIAQQIFMGGEDLSAD
jgi:GTPase SAR1 family protein